jgi:hypothetical protein
MRWDESFADDLIARLGAVSGRVALLLRSTEAKPTSSRFVPQEHAPPSSEATVRPAGVEWRGGGVVGGEGHRGMEEWGRGGCGEGPQGWRSGGGVVVGKGPRGGGRSGGGF